VPSAATHFIDLKDDDFEHGVTATDIIPDVGLFASRFRPACVEFGGRDDLSASDDDPVSQLGEIPFDLNTTGDLDGDMSDLHNIHNNWRQSATEPDFWSAYLVGAFQIYAAGDNDNDLEAGTLGYTSSNDAISAIFRETVRDIKTEEPNVFVMGEEDVWRVAGLHEVAHQFNLGHDVTDDGPIMDAESFQTKQVEELIFSPKGLQKITARDFPREFED